MPHTPGPWVVDDANPELVAQLVEGIYEYVASTAIGNFCSTERSGKEEEANARLIAAAPDLLEACKKALEAICAGAELWMLEDVKLHCRAAIAKAEKG